MKERTLLLERVRVDGHLAAVHPRFRTEGDRGSAVVDRFRLEDGKIVEHWDSVQAVPAEAANSNVML